MLTLNNLNRLIIGLIAAVFGVGLWVISPKPTTQASDVTHYSSTWTATNYLIASRTIVNKPTDEIILGVGTWKVTGAFENSGPQFKEIWDSPNSDLPNFTATRSMPTGSGPLWIAGALWNNTHTTDAITISKVPLNHVFANFIANGASHAGKFTSTCQAGDATECFYATGTYGFRDYHDFPAATSGKDITVGVAMPAQWTVTGTLCEVPAADCQ